MPVLFRLRTVVFLGGIICLMCGPLSAAETDFSSDTQVQALQLDPENVLNFEFVISRDEADQSLEIRAERLIRMFFTALTVPESRMWVNLSPHEPERVIPEVLADTDLGRVLLDQDLQLKRLTGRLMRPDHPAGERFWKRIQALSLTPEISNQISALNRKVWIVPERSVLFEHSQGVVILESRLKVLTDEEYTAKTEDSEERAIYGGSQSLRVFKEEILPVIEYEVNHGESFGPIRRIHRLLVLSSWYKSRMSEGYLGEHYLDRSLTKGIPVHVDRSIEQIYQDYVRTYHEGDTLLREEYDPLTQQMIPRQYVSGGFIYPGLEADQSSDAMMARQILDDATDVIAARLRPPLADPAELDWSHIPLKYALIYGPQASGKGTQAEMIAEARGIKHISVGDVLRVIQNSLQEKQKALDLLRQVADQHGIDLRNVNLLGVLDRWYQHHPPLSLAERQARDYMDVWLALAGNEADAIKTGMDEFYAWGLSWEAIGDEIIQAILTVMDQGGMIKPAYTDQIVFQVLLKYQDQGFLIDGYPRDMESYLALVEFLKLHQINIDAVIEVQLNTITNGELVLDEDEIFERIVKRAEAQGRKDDQKRKSVQNRLDYFKINTVPVIALWRERADVFIPVNGNPTGMKSVQESIAAIYEDIHTRLFEVLVDKKSVADHGSLADTAFTKGGIDLAESRRTIELRQEGNGVIIPAVPVAGLGNGLGDPIPMLIGIRRIEP